MNRNAVKALKHHNKNKLSRYQSKEPNPNDFSVSLLKENLQMYFNKGVCYRCRKKSRLRVGRIGSQPVKFCARCAKAYRVDKSNNEDI